MNENRFRKTLKKLSKVSNHLKTREKSFLEKLKRKVKKFEFIRKVKKLESVRKHEKAFQFTINQK